MTATARPFFSIVTVCFDAEYGIEETVKSLMLQSCDDYEYIVIDGLSTDGTADVLERYKERIDAFKQEEDCGIYDAMNKAMKLVTGRYVYFLNAGDSFLDDKVLDNMKSQITEAGMPSMVVGNLRTKKGVVRPNPSLICRSWIRRTLPHQAIFVDSSCHGTFDTSYSIAADFDKLLELSLRNNDVVYVDRDIAYYDVLKLDKTRRQRQEYCSRSSFEKMKICKRRLSGATGMLSTTFYFCHWLKSHVKRIRFIAA